MTENPTSADWSQARGERWAAELTRMEAMLAPIDEPLLGVLALDGPVRVADVACGGGGTTLAIARRAPEGSVVHGYDISPELVRAARDRAPPDAGVTFEVADIGATTPSAPYDRLVSRFGTMFFPDPPAAFANLARWIAPGGRFAFAVWASPKDNPWMFGARGALSRVIDIPPPDPEAPGPFRYGDVNKLLALLDGAGFVDVVASDWRGDLALGGGMPAAEAAAFVLAGFPALASVVESLGPTKVDEARRELATFFSQHERDGAVRIAARVHLLTGGVRASAR